MRQEYNSVQSNGTWRLVELLPAKKHVRNKWVFRKVIEQGRVKVKLIVKGFSQRRGVDYSDTFLPVVRYETLTDFIGA